MTGCALPHGADEHGNPRRAGTYAGLLCAAHFHALEELLAEIGHLLVDTRRVVDGGAPKDHAPRVKHVKSPEAAPPGDLTLMALFDARTKNVRIPGDDDSDPLPAVPAVIASWVLALADERPLTAKLPRSLPAQLALLLRHVEWIAGRPWVDDLHVELGEVRDALRHAVGDTDRFLMARCDLAVEDADGGVSLCGGPIWRRNGQETWECARCRAQWITDQQRARFGIRQ